MRAITIVRDIAIVLVLIVLAVFLFGIGVGQRTIDNDNAIDSAAAVFQEELTARAIDAMGGLMPIEGFDAAMLLDVFPELEPRDFDGAETTDGVYAYANGALSLIDRDPTMETSAAYTVTAHGYETLLTNVATRFSIDPREPGGVDAVLEAITTTEVLSGTPPQGFGRLRGTVMVGPQCSVVRVGDECPDAPFVGTVAILVDDPEQELISRLETNEEGEFEVLLEPAGYIVRVEHEGEFPICEDEGVTILEGETVTISVACDSGIR